MKFIIDMDNEKFEAFVKNHPTKSHFLQSYTWGEFSKTNKHMIPHYVGLVNEENEIIATALLLEKKLPLGYSYFYSPRGFILNYNNKDIIKMFTNEIKKYIKSYKAIFLKIDPDLIYQNLSNKDNINNMDLINYLKSIGYKHMGFNKNFEMDQPRYTFRLNLSNDMEYIVNNFHPTTKKIYKRGNPYNLICIKNNENYIKEFYSTMNETANRENILIYNIDYYLNFYKELHKNNMSDLYVVQVDINSVKKIYHDTIEDLEKQLKAIKTDTKRNEIYNQLNKLNKEKEEINKLDIDIITLSSIITVKFGNKVWTIHGGNSTKLRFLNSNYYIYFKIIEDAKKDGYEIIDFFGTTGNPVTDNPVYGIHLFKSRLGGDYLEFIGEFDLITNKFMYFMFTKLIPIYRKIVKAISKKSKKGN